ncbi:MAG: site-specific DNA-methyltransferase [Gammaproteobacteria bacterium]|nr:site-specific DNA-methyltransferase [Gammaproteobacteria bacterium]
MAIKQILKTKYGKAIQAEANNYMNQRLPDASVDLIITSPPYALLQPKSYGNKPQDDYLDWFLSFAKNFYRILKPKGSLVIDIGGSWIKGQPSRSLQHIELPILLCRKYGFYLAQEFLWENTNKLPTPAQWVTVKRVRVKDAVNFVWWLSKDPNPKADNKKVLKPYSKAQENLFKMGYNSETRPSQHKISDKFGNKNKGAIPPNVIREYNEPTNHFKVPNSIESNYNKYCRKKGYKIHPAKFPPFLPEFFIKMTTDKGDTVYDPFGGSCTTGYMAEKLERNWICTDLDDEFLRGAKGWFLPS